MKVGFRSHHIDLFVLYALIYISENVRCVEFVELCLSLFICSKNISFIYFANQNTEAYIKKKKKNQCHEKYFGKNTFDNAVRETIIIGIA